jgi:MFS family permease
VPAGEGGIEYPRIVAEPSSSDAPATPGGPRRPDPAVEPLSEAARRVARSAEGEHFSTLRLFGTTAYLRLWIAQVVSSLGDWIGFFAITAIAARLGGSSSGVAVGVVLSARLIPGFFLGPLVGVVVDRWSRKRMMVACDVGRAVVLASLPFVRSVVGLFFASLLLELMTLMWSSAKEASVPNLVPAEFLPNANSLSLVAGYGTFPLGAAVFSLLAKVAESLSEVEALQALRVDRQESIAIYFDVVTFLFSALIVTTLAIRQTSRRELERGKGLSGTWHELREGWRFVAGNRVVRAVIFGLATGLFGGGMLVPLGPDFSREVLGGGSAGFGLLLTALGLGVAVGILSLSLVQRRLPQERIFVIAVVCAGLAILTGASFNDLRPALVAVGILGLCAGAVYVLGFTILQINVEDELRGRIFATLYTLVRLCLLLAFVLAPLLSTLLDRLSARLFDRHVELFGVGVSIPGARLTLWLGGVIILFAGVVSTSVVRPKEVE